MAVRANFPAAVQPLVLIDLSPLTRVPPQASFVLLSVFPVSSGGRRENMAVVSLLTGQQLQATGSVWPSGGQLGRLVPTPEKISSIPNCCSVSMITFMHIYLADVSLTGSKNSWKRLKLKSEY